jgi:hypothetical protein
MPIFAAFDSPGPLTRIHHRQRHRFDALVAPSTGHLFA